MENKQTARVQNAGGYWFEVDAAGVRIKILGQDDKTANEHIIYDAKCGRCWLGYAHSGDWHRYELSLLSSERA